MITTNLGGRSQMQALRKVSGLREHPQYATYTVNICTEQKAKVPNFVGGALPRLDQGDREDYWHDIVDIVQTMAHREGAEGSI